jgi:hypothetical protein
VFSSTVFYGNFVAYSLLGQQGHFWTSPWLNPFVLGANLDSVMNDVALLLMSGIPKRLVTAIHDTSPLLMYRKFKHKHSPNSDSEGGCSYIFNSNSDPNSSSPHETLASQESNTSTGNTGDKGSSADVSVKAAPDPVAFAKNIVQVAPLLSPVLPAPDNSPLPNVLQE